jgi:hypothetical protein
VEMGHGDVDHGKVSCGIQFKKGVILLRVE